MLAKAQSEQITVEALNVTTDGTYTAETGKAYSPVTVSVENGVYAELLAETWGS